MRILNTRPKADASKLTMELKLYGHTVLEAPIIDIVFLNEGELSFHDVQAIIVTSSNGVRGLARNTSARSIALFAVGNATASLAKELGFKRVKTAAGDVESLINEVTDVLAPANGALVHAAGHYVAGDLVGSLNSSGFKVKRVTLYEARSATRLPKKTEIALKQDQIDAVLFFSSRTARGFVQLVSMAGLSDKCQILEAFCLSDSVAAEAAGLPWLKVHVSERPELKSMISCLNRRSAAIANQG